MNFNRKTSQRVFNNHLNKNLIIRKRLEEITKDNRNKRIILKIKKLSQ